MVESVVSQHPRFELEIAVILIRPSRVIFLFIFGYRIEAISIIGKEVMLPRGLVRLGLDTLDQSQAEIRETLSLYTNAAALPSIVHCTQGKDRTGLLHINYTKTV